MPITPEYTVAALKDGIIDVVAHRRLMYFLYHNFKFNGYMKESSTLTVVVTKTLVMLQDIMQLCAVLEAAVYHLGV